MQIKKLVSNVDFSKEKSGVLAFNAFDIAQFERALREEGENFWQKKGEHKALALFHEAAERVPAYKNFLKKNKINHHDVETIDDFKKVPVTDKKNYINTYPLKDRCWDGNLSSSAIIAASSGTSGEPTFWPRSHYQELESAVTHELIFRYLYQIDTHKTLVVICFPVGIYISGMATVLPSWLISTKKYNLTCVTVGNNKPEALRAIKNLQNEYEQVILIGHPFFVKDVIETGRQIGINWSKNLFRLMFCSGSFDERWRKYVMSKAGVNKKSEIISTYGCSEMLLIGHETPLSIFARTAMDEHKDMRSLLHSPETVPNIFQYNPLLRYIEMVNKELIFTSASGLPLVRFNLHDSGEVVTFKKMTNKLSEDIPHWKKEIQTKQHYPIWNLPFVTLYGRSDYTVKFFAANIYPDHIRIALSHKLFLPLLTGKFVMVKGYSKNMDESLEINIELEPGLLPSKKLAQKIQSAVVSKLKEINREYADASKHLPNKDLRPRIRLWPYQHEKYFKLGLKPKFIL